MREKTRKLEVEIVLGLLDAEPNEEHAELKEAHYFYTLFRKYLTGARIGAQNILKKLKDAKGSEIRNDPYADIFHRGVLLEENGQRAAARACVNLAGYSLAHSHPETSAKIAEYAKGNHRAA